MSLLSKVRPRMLFLFDNICLICIICVILSVLMYCVLVSGIFRQNCNINLHYISRATNFKKVINEKPNNGELISKVPLKYASILDETNILSLTNEEDIKKFIKKKKKRMELDYIIHQQQRIKYNKRLKKELLQEMPENHSVFVRLKYEPTFPSNGFPPTDLSKCDPNVPVRDPTAWKRRRVGLIGQKIGMMQLFTSNGYAKPITIIRIDNCEVTQLKTEITGKYGYCRMQIGYGHAFIRHKNFSELGHFVAQGVAPKKKLKEFKVHRDGLLPVGTPLTVEHFLVGQYVDVQGIEKGFGFQGVMKRWHFRGGPATHGSSKFHRKRGSFGGCSDPGKVWKGAKMPGRMGGKKATHHSLQVFRIDPKQNLMYVIGHIPGYKGNYVKIRDAWFRPPNRPPFPTFFPNPNKPINDVRQMDDAQNKWIWERDPDSETWGDKVSPDLL